MLAAEISFTEPYFDASGLGIMITAAIPVFHKVSNTFLGVVGTDFVLKDIEDIVSNFHWGRAYSFLINKEGEVLIHPLVVPSDEFVSNPVFQDISNIEEVNGQPVEFEIVKTSMMNREYGHLKS